MIGFDGTAFEGWQSQRKTPSKSSGLHKTLQEVFEKILEQILKEKVSLISSSRTDSGVHARGMVAHFKTQSALTDRSLKEALNFYLPKEVVVYSAKTAPSSFHARYDAKSKLYEYRIWNSATRPLFEAKTVLWYKSPLNVSLMKKAARYLVGRHDFAAFKDKREEHKTTVRTIQSIRIKKSKETIAIQISGDGFLTHMVRIIVGTLIDVGRKKIPPAKVSHILQSKDRSQAGSTAKPQGLTLLKVKY